MATMDSGAVVDRQIRQMVDFIKLEAKEKATEIRLKVCLCQSAESALSSLRGSPRLHQFVH
jgi:hypothetical protein